MARLGFPVKRPDAVLAEIKRLTDSSVLHGSESLCKLLRFLAQHSIETPEVPVKEYQIATQVLGRSPDFDPRIDSAVRVHTARLRSKLAEYYAGEGVGNQVVVEIPKGSYSLVCHARSSSAVPAPQPGSAAAPTSPRRSWFWVGVLTGALVGGVVVLAGARVLVRPQSAASAAARDPLPAPVRSFWSAFLSGPEAPLVVFSNAKFVGWADTGLRYYNPAFDQGKPLVDLYTGIGEVLAIHELDQVFAELPHQVRVKRAGLLTWDDAKNCELIFIGSPLENPSLRELPRTLDFVFERPKNGTSYVKSVIANLHPGTGEQPVYRASGSLPITEDYAVIALTPGLTHSRRALILAGLSTFGTQAAVEYVCRPAGLEQLLAKIRSPKDGRLPAFEAVLRVKVSGGVPVQSELVALRKHADPPPASVE